MVHENDEELTRDRGFGVYHLLYLREGERTRRTRRSRASHPTLTVLTACGAVCAALRGLGQPEAPQPHGSRMSKLDASLRSCCACEVAATSGSDPCSGCVSGSRGAFSVLVVGRWVAAAPGCVLCRCGRTFARLELFDGSYVLSEC